MNLVERCGKVHDLIRKLMETQDYEAIKLLGEVVSADNINIRKSYMVATKSFRDKLGEVREGMVEDYDSELGINKVQASIIAESQHVLKKYEGETVGNVLRNIKDDLQHSLNKFLAENEVYQKHFPVKFENGLGKWEINSDGTTKVQPKRGVQHIVCDFTIENSGAVRIKEYSNLEAAYTVYSELMLTPQWRYNHRMNLEWLIEDENGLLGRIHKTETTYRHLTREEFADRLLTNDRFNNRWGMGCTVDLCHDERKELEIRKRYKESGYKFMSPGVFTADNGPTSQHLDSIGIPKRKFR